MDSKKLKADACNLAASLISIKRCDATVEKYKEIRGDCDQYGTAEDYTQSLPITVRAKPDDEQKPSTDSKESKMPGFDVLIAAIGLLVTAYMVRRK